MGKPLLKSRVNNNHSNNAHNLQNHDNLIAMKILERSKLDLNATAKSLGGSLEVSGYSDWHPLALGIVKA
jgi:hypothetical protein